MPSILTSSTNFMFLQKPYYSGFIEYVMAKCFLVSHNGEPMQNDLSTTHSLVNPLEWHAAMEAENSGETFSFVFGLSKRNTFFATNNVKNHPF